VMAMWETTGGEREVQDEKCPTLREPSSLGCNDPYEKTNIHSFQMTE